MPEDLSQNRILLDLLEQIDDSDISSSRRVISEIIRVINDKNSTAKDLKDIIELDPSLTIRVLRFANSAYYGRTREVSEIQEAIIWIGFDALKEIALNQKVSELFAKNTKVENYSRLDLWKHSVAVAICSKLIFRREFGRKGDSIYAAGLLHNIGILIEDQFLHHQFEEILHRMLETNKNISEVERDLLGFTHSELAGILAKRWALPDELVFSVGAHENPVIKEEKVNIQSAYTLYIADFVCQRRRLGFQDMPYSDNRIFHHCLRELQIKERALDFIMAEVEHEISTLEKQGWFQEDE